MLENNPAGLNRAEIDRAAGNQFNILLTQQQRKHRTRECEEQGANKSAMPEKLNVPATPEVGRMAALIGPTRGGSEEE